MISALVVDDGTVIDAHVRQHMDNTPIETSVLADSCGVQQALASESYDVLLLNTHLDACDVCRRIRSNPATATLPIVSCSKYDDLEERLRYFRMGTDDFVILPCDGRELVARIKAVVNRARRPFQTQSTLYAAEGKIELDTQTKTIKLGSVTLHLTRLEYLLIFQLMRVAGQYVPTEQLLEDVWGYPKGTGDPTLVRTQIRNLRRKLQDVDPATECLRSAPGLGYQITA